MGRKLSVFVLSSFLNMGMTFATFNLFGYTHVISDWLIMTRKGFVKAGDKHFRRHVEIPPCPEDDLLRMFL